MKVSSVLRFKPYYKWITFNTKHVVTEVQPVGFKPYYKWITFNTLTKIPQGLNSAVLNLIINGLPSIHKYLIGEISECCFKPYYKWITFNT